MTRTLLTVLILGICLSALGQSRKKPAQPFNSMNRSENSKFLDKQWWLGFKAGVNLTNPESQKNFSILTPTNYALTSVQKTYKSFNKTGAQAALEITFAFRGIAVSLQPTYKTSRFTYMNRFEWRNTEHPEEELILNFDQEQQVDYADFPLLVKYEILGDKLRPYVQAGVFYSVLTNATKTVVVSGTDRASGGVNTIRNEPVIVGARDMFANYWGLLAGAGVNYNLGNVRLVLDISYRHGMSNVANTGNRFSSDRLNGVGDVQDDLTIHHLVFSGGCLFPLRFLSSNFKSLD